MAWLRTGRQAPPWNSVNKSSRATWLPVPLSSWVDVPTWGRPQTPAAQAATPALQKPTFKN